MSAGTKCDRCSSLIKSGERKGQWTACTCPNGPTRQPVPQAWKRGSGT